MGTEVADGGAGGLQGRALVEEIDRCDLPVGQAGVWWLGQQGYVMKFGAAVVYVDAYLSPGKARLVPPLLSPGELGHATLVLGSHDHSDHIDRGVWPAIAAAAPAARFVVPKAVASVVAAGLGIDPGRVAGVDNGLRFEYGGVAVTGVPAAHELLAPDPVTGLHPEVGFIIEGHGVTVYHAGDSCIYEGMQALLRRWRIDLACLPINGRDARRLAANCIGNMTYQEAADLAGALRPGLTIPGHFDMFRGNSEDPALFTAYMAVKYPGLASQVPVHGRRITVTASGR